MLDSTNNEYSDNEKGLRRLDSVSLHQIPNTRIYSILRSSPLYVLCVQPYNNRQEELRFILPRALNREGVEKLQLGKVSRGGV
jgi:hypothetical protein